MAFTFTNVLPVFTLILIGWVLVASGYLRAEIGEGLGAFAFKVAVPTLIFMTLAQADFRGASPFRLWSAYFGGIAIAWIAGQLAAKRAFDRDGKAAIVAGFASSFSNLGFIGLPLIGSLFGHDGLLVLSLILAIHLPVMMTISTILVENHNGKPGKRNWSKTARNIVRSLIRNPIVVAISLGLAFHFSGATLYPPFKIVGDRVAAMAGPLSLFAVGMSLRRDPVMGNFVPAMTIGMIKLVVMPFAVLVLARLVELPPLWAMTAVLAASMPTGINSWLLANQFKIDSNLAAAVVTLSTALGVITVSMWSGFLTTP